jgi:hypothetical protein
MRLYKKVYNSNMSTKQGKIGLHRFNGDPARFEVVADYIGSHFKRKARYVADVAGGQGMLCRYLTKKYNFDCTVIDPREHVLTGVKSIQAEYTKDMADYYDLIVGLHPDEALREVVESALVRPVVVIPCCNFWSKEEKLGREALLAKIEAYYKENSIMSERVIFDFEGPKNIGLVAVPAHSAS